MIPAIFIISAFFLSGCESFFNMSQTGSTDDVMVTTQDIAVTDTKVGEDIKVPYDTYNPTVKSSLSGSLDIPDALKSDWKNIRVLLITDLSSAGSHVRQMTTPQKDGTFKFANFQPGTYYLYAFHFEKQGLSVLPDAIGVSGNDPAHPKTIKIPADKPVVKGVLLKLAPQYIPYGNGSIHGNVTLDNPDFDPMNAVLFLGDNPEISKCNWYVMTIINSDQDIMIKGLSPARYYLKAYLLKNGDINQPIGYGYYNDGFFPKGINITKDQPDVSKVEFHIFDYVQSPALMGGQVTGTSGGLTYVVFLKEPFPVNGHLPKDFIQVDPDGKYLESTLPYGTYYVYAYHFKDQASVCPDCYDALGFYAGNGNFPKAVTLSEAHKIVGNINIKMTPFEKGRGVICGQVEYSQAINQDLTRVYCTHNAMTGTDDTPVRWAIVDKDGYFCVRNLPLDTAFYVHASQVTDFHTMDVVAKGTYTGQNHAPVPLVLTLHRTEFDGAFIQMKKVVHTGLTLDIRLDASKTAGLKPENTAICLTRYPYPDMDKCTNISVPGSDWHLKIQDVPGEALYVFAITRDPVTGQARAMAYYANNGIGLPIRLNMSKSPVINMVLKAIPLGKCRISGMVNQSDTSTVVAILQNGIRSLSAMEPVMFTGADSDGKFTMDGLACGYYMPIAMDFTNADTGNLPTRAGMPVSGGIPMPIDVALSGPASISMLDVAHGGGAIVVNVHDIAAWAGDNIAIMLYPGAPEWKKPPYPLVQTPDSLGHAVFTDVPDGDWYVYAFAYPDAMPATVYAQGVSSVATIPVPITVNNLHEHANIDIVLHKKTVGEGVITGHITNIGPNIDYSQEAVFLFDHTNTDPDPKTGAVSAVRVQDDGTYLFNGLKNGRYYIYAAHYPAGDFSASPNATGFYTTGTTPKPVIITSQSNAIKTGIDLVVRQKIN